MTREDEYRIGDFLQEDTTAHICQDDTPSEPASM